jgi:hypothetical protein
MQRQDITGLELTDMGGGVPRILAAVGVRGFATAVQFDLGSNGANVIYSAAMSSSGYPNFTSIASNANGFVFTNAVNGSDQDASKNQDFCLLGTMSAVAILDLDRMAGRGPKRCEGASHSEGGSLTMMLRAAT